MLRRSHAYNRSRVLSKGHRIRDASGSEEPITPRIPNDSERFVLFFMQQSDTIGASLIACSRSMRIQRDHGLYSTSAIDEPTLAALGMA